jgi:hypothetical protein
MRSLKKWLILSAFLSLCHFAKAYTGGNGKKSCEGSVHGYVMDANTRKPVSGVTVSVSSSKIQGEKEICSNASGYFNFGKLPAGEVTIMFQKKGYKLFRKDIISLKEGTTVKLSVEVEPENDNTDIWHPFYRLLNEE